MQGIKITFPILGDDFVLDPPTYFSVFGRHITLYAVIIMAGFILAGLYIIKRRSVFGLTQDNVYDMFLIAVPTGIVGARLYYVIFNPEGYFGAGNWLNIFKVWNGGLAIYGGVIAVSVGLIIYARVKKIPAGAIFDASALGVLIGQAIGRWGNFINREAFGYETDVPWRMGLTYPGGGTIFVHPTFLYESLWNVIGFILLHLLSKYHRKFDGQLILMYLVWYGFGRFWIEGLRTDSLYVFQTDIRVSQLVAAVTAVVGAFFLIRNWLRAKKEPVSLYADRVLTVADDTQAPDTDDD